MFPRACEEPNLTTCCIHRWHSAHRTSPHPQHAAQHRSSGRARGLLGTGLVGTGPVGMGPAAGRELLELVPQPMPHGSPPVPAALPSQPGAARCTRLGSSRGAGTQPGTRRCLVPGVRVHTVLQDTRSPQCQTQQLLGNAQERRGGSGVGGAGLGAGCQQQPRDTLSLQRGAGGRHPQCPRLCAGHAGMGTGLAPSREVPTHQTLTHSLGGVGWVLHSMQAIAGDLAH